MNMTSFSMHSRAHFSPVTYASTTLNHVIYCITHVIADQKFMAIFSILFSVSTKLFVERLIGRGQNPFLLFYSRNFCLLIIGLIHSYFIWDGDILIIYALCSLFYIYSRIFHLGFNLLYVYCIPSLIGINNY